nr:hypothetical protein [Tanacetum cinerariifolium]
MQDDPPVDIYQRLEEHDRDMQEMKRQQAEMDVKMKKLMKEMHVGTMHPVNTRPIFVGQHYGVFTGWPNFVHDAECNESGKDSSSSEQVLSESVYELADTTVAPKKRPDKSKNNARNGKARDLLRVNEFLFNPYPVYLDCHTKGDRAMESFWRELVPDLYMAGYYNFCNDGTVNWLSDDKQAHGARFTMAKAGTASKYPGSQQFVIVTDEHIKGTLDGTTRPYP